MEKFESKSLECGSAGALFNLDVEELSQNVDTSMMMRHLEEFSKRIKLSGTPEEFESFQYLEAEMRALGFGTKILNHDAYISLPGNARLVFDGVTPRCITHSFSRSTAQSGLRGEVVFLGVGSANDFAKADVRGKIVLIETMANPNAAARASAAGASGQIHISPHEHLHEMCISPVWGSPDHEQIDKLPKTVVLTVEHEFGAALRDRLKAGEKLFVEMFTEVDTRWRTTPILVAELPTLSGAEDEPFVMFSGHHDTWYYGVMDNGAANATMLEVARIITACRAHWRRGLRLCFWSGHSHGRYSGSTWYADTYWAELERRCVVHVNVDSTGGKGNTILADTPASAELLGLAREAVRIQGGQEIDGHRVGRAGDQSFWGIGIPSLFMGMSEAPADIGTNASSAVFGGTDRKGAGFGWWWHTPDDTLDKIDPHILAMDTRIYVHAIGRLLTDVLLPFDYAEHAAAFGKVLARLDADLGERFDLSELVAASRDLETKAKDFRSKFEGTVDDAEATRYNKALMAVGRAVVPIDYTSGDRFGQDPALPQAAYHILDPLRKLSMAEPESDEARFITVKARRIRNRIASAIAQACAEIDAVALRD